MNHYRKKMTGAFLALAMVVSIPAFADEQVIDSGISKLKSLMEITKQTYVNEVSDEELLEAAYRGLFDSADSDSVYYNAEEFFVFMDQINSSSTNVGITVDSQNNLTIVASVNKDSSALEQGIMPGDVITSINGVEVNGKAENEIDTLLSGYDGLYVTIKVHREDVQDELEFSLMCKPMNPNQIVYEVINNIGYIKVIQFTQANMNYFDDALSVLLDENGVEGLVIDVRDNSDGEVDAVASAIDHFMPINLRLMTIDYRVGEDENLISQKDRIDLPLVILVNERSIGSAEIFAGSLKESGYASLVGTQTFGDGSVQWITPLEDGSGIKLTIGMIYTTGMNLFDKIGIQPNYILENKNRELDRIFARFSAMNSIRNSIVGMRDSDTLGAQQRLNYLGYTTKESGYFNRETELALAKFQMDNGILNSGILNWETKAKLDEVVRMKASQVIDDLQKEKAFQLISDLIK